MRSLNGSAYACIRLFLGKFGQKSDETEILDKKKKLKAKFDAEYDEKEGDATGTYYNDLKQDVTKQTEVSKKYNEMSAPRYHIPIQYNM